MDFDAIIFDSTKFVYFHFQHIFQRKLYYNQYLKLMLSSYRENLYLSGIFEAPAEKLEFSELFFILLLESTSSRSIFKYELLLELYYFLFRLIHNYFLIQLMVFSLKKYILLFHSFIMKYNPRF